MAQKFTKEVEVSGVTTAMVLYTTEEKKPMVLEFSYIMHPQRATASYFNDEGRWKRFKMRVEQFDGLATPVTEEDEKKHADRIEGLVLVAFEEFGKVLLPEKK